MFCLHSRPDLAGVGMRSVGTRWLQHLNLRVGQSLIKIRVVVTGTPGNGMWCVFVEDRAPLTGTLPWHRAVRAGFSEYNGVTRVNGDLIHDLRYIFLCRALPPTIRQPEIHFVRPCDTGEAALTFTNCIQFKRNSHEAVVKLAVGEVVVVLTTIGRTHQVFAGAAACPLTTSMQIQASWMLGIVHLDVAMVETVVVPEQCLQIGSDSGQINQVSISTTPFQH